VILAIGLALAQETCATLDPVADHVQVAWVSRAPAHVGLHGEVVVVTTRELLEIAAARGKDPVATLRALGVRDPGGSWKVTVFDVDRAELCRPVEGEGSLEGLNRCDHPRRPRGVRPRSWSGCGYLLDATDGTRTADVYGIEWADAADQGFCVLPLSRFLQGPPR
jgi:hypothetical protein